MAIFPKKIDRSPENQNSHSTSHDNNSQHRIRVPQTNFRNQNYKRQMNKCQTLFQLHSYLPE